jgi:protein TonB
MKKHVLFLACIIAYTCTFAQVQTPTDSTDENFVYFTVDEEAKFPGGLNGWKNFLERNLNADAPRRDGAKFGVYPVVVQFIVDKNGLVSNVKAIDGKPDCPSCMVEAARVIRKGPKWIPAKHKGQPVKYQAYQRITFLLDQ